jgi:hypothetical protein
MTHVGVGRRVITGRRMGVEGVNPVGPDQAQVAVVEDDFKPPQLDAFKLDWFGDGRQPPVLQVPVDFGEFFLQRLDVTQHVPQRGHGLGHCLCPCLVGEAAELLDQGFIDAGQHLDGNNGGRGPFSAADQIQSATGVPDAIPVKVGSPHRLGTRFRKLFVQRLGKSQSCSLVTVDHGMGSSEWRY